MTMSETQGQTLSIVRVYLPAPTVSHICCIVECCQSPANPLGFTLTAHDQWLDKEYSRDDGFKFVKF